MPRSALERGVASCIQVARNRLTEARALIDAGGFATQAAIVCSFGVEEFGKALLLRAAYEAGEDPVTLDWFFDHFAKFEAAEEAMGWRPLLYGGAFDADAFSSHGFDSDVEVSFDARLSALYVNWIDGDWKTGISIDHEVLHDSIGRVEHAILDATIRWSKIDAR